MASEEPADSTFVVVEANQLEEGKEVQEISSNLPSCSHESNVKINFRILVEKHVLGKVEGLYIKCISKDRHHQIGKDMYHIRSFGNEFDEFSGFIELPQKQIGQKLLKYKIFASEQRLLHEAKMEIKYFLDSRFDIHYQFDFIRLPNFGGQETEEKIISSFWNGIWEVNSLEEKIDNLVGFCNSFNGKKSFSNLILKKLQETCNMQEQNIGVEDKFIAFVDILALMTGLIASGCKMDEFIFPISTSLSLKYLKDEEKIIEKFAQHLKNHLEIVFDSLKVLWKAVKNGIRNPKSNSRIPFFSKTIEPEWVYLLVLIDLFTEFYSSCRISDNDIISQTYHGSNPVITRNHLHSILNNIQDYGFCLKLDRLLQRLLVSLMCPEDFSMALKCCSFDIVLIIDAMRKHIDKPGGSKHELQIDHLINALCVLFSLQEKRENFGKDYHWILNELCELLFGAFQKLDWPVFNQFYIILLRIIGGFETAPTETNEILENISTVLRCNVKAFNGLDKAIEQLPIFNQLFTLKIGDADCRKIHDESYNILSENVYKMADDHPTLYIKFYNKINLHEQSNEIQELLSTGVEKTFNSRTNIFSKPYMENLFKSSNACKRFLSYLKDQWEAQEAFPSSYSIVGKVVMNDSTTVCLKNLSKIEDDDLRRFIDDIAKQLCFSHSTSFSKISLREAKCIVYHRDDFLAFYDNAVKKVCKLCKTKPFSREYVGNNIDGLQNVIDKKEQVVMSIEYFLNFLDGTKVVDETLFNMFDINFDDVAVGELVDSGYFANHFSVQESHVDMLQKLQNCDILCSKVFLSIWEEQQFKFDAKKWNGLKPIIESFINPVLDKLKEWINDFINANIEASVIKTIFSKIESHVIRKELKSCIDYFEIVNAESKLNKVISKLEILQNMERIDWLGETILVILKGLDNTSSHNDSFSDTVKEICEKRREFNNTKLCDIEENLLTHATLLGKINKNHERLLKTLKESLDLITWIRQQFKGEKELKDFIDIVSNCAQTSLEVQIVISFDKACNGIKDILFINNEQSKYSEFLEKTRRCAQVLSSVNRLHAILTTLVESSDHLAWFKSSLGSSEERTFSKIRNINRRGCYIISLDTTQYLQNKVNKDSMMKIVLPPDKVLATMKTGLNWFDMNADIIQNISSGDEYKSSEIDDIQSLLVLLGDSKMDEDRKKQKYYFSQVFTSMKELASVNYNLIQVGYLEQFNHVYIFKCNDKEILELPTTLISDLFKKYNSQKERIKKLRIEEPLLNYFSMKQCLMLQIYLVDFLKGSSHKRFSYQVIALLDSVSKDLDLPKVKKILEKVLDKPQRIKTSECADDEVICNRFSGLTVDYLKKIISEVVKIEKSEEIAYASLMAIDPINEDEACKWCCKTELDDDEIEAMAAESEDLIRQKSGCFDDNEGYDNNESDNVTSEPDVMLEENNDNLHYITLDQLVCFLKEVKLKTRAMISNVKESLFKEGIPYLITIKREEIMTAVLQIYYESYEKLPSFENVLYCRKDTSKEEVELLIRRAMLETKGIFALMYIEELDFRISQEVVSFLQSELQCHELKNPLLLFCSSEKEYNNLFVSTLGAYRYILWVTNENEEMTKDENVALIEKNFKKCLIYTDKKRISAAEVFKERSYCLVVSSSQSGMGKSFQVEKIADLLKRELLKKNTSINNVSTKISIPILGEHIDIDEITNSLLYLETQKDQRFPMIYHFDISPTVSSGLESFLFNLVVLGKLKNTNGAIWKRRAIDAVVLEVTFSNAFVEQNSTQILKMLPELICTPPAEKHKNKKGEDTTENPLDYNMFISEKYQRVYQYLSAYDTKRDLANVKYEKNYVFGRKENFMETIIKYCGKEKPSWIELSNFLMFFNQQLEDCEGCIYCKKIPQTRFSSRLFSFLNIFGQNINEEMMRGFKHFVVKLCLKMSKDFSVGSVACVNGDENMICVDSARKWENSLHPYLFFNDDHSTFSFVGFNIDKEGNLLSAKTKVGSGTKQIIMKNAMTPYLYEEISRQFLEDDIKFNTVFTKLNKNTKLQLLCRVMGVEYSANIDPNPSFVLTIDTVQKILAIHMRFRTNIPVIMSGETGCGKTELIKYMAKLSRSGKKDVNNLMLVKLHGGTTNDNVNEYVKHGMEVAKTNYKKGIDTILFFDECNTSESVGLIKEIMIDSSCLGQPIDFEKYRLKFVAAINPYKRHSEHMIKKLETSGLGYFNGNEEHLEHLGKIPLRQLVYRVLKLPKSMEYCVWDFGELDEKTENEYIEEMVKKDGDIKYTNRQKKFMVAMLCFSQQYMRKQKDECRYVSLRDVERTIQVMSWFHSKSHLFITRAEKKEDELFKIECLLSLCVCYILKLNNRAKFINEIPWFNHDDMAIIERIQKETVKRMVLGDNVALNKALCENVFMMLVCIELRIPLFIVGKPGCSKSFAKSIIEENMEGEISKSEFCRNFKQVFMASYQCSILSTAEGVISTFQHCQKYQENKDHKKFVSVAVFDEVGLAEASPKMPLKALHPLLEDGTDCFEPLAIDDRKGIHIRPAFIGLSNFAIDPAKMNRGIILNHPTPDEAELYITASQLCESHLEVKIPLEKLLKKLTKGYFDVYNKQKENKQLKKYKKPEFYGLRDFYSLIKEVICLGKQVKGIPSLELVKVVIQRNFSGLEDFDSWSYFQKYLKDLYSQEPKGTSSLLPVELVKQSLERKCPCNVSQQTEKKCLKKCFNSRYLLLMTEEHLDVVQNNLLKDDQNVDIIYGSSFPNDEEFSKVCRDVTHVKMCMESGKTVVLLNMENLYESLYDALNQHYVYFGGERYVNLGLGAHRVKCRVHNDFKLIVIADVNKVYSQFPIPLINRLEKHFLLPTLSMNSEEKDICKEVHQWAMQFTRHRVDDHNLKHCQAFPGYNQYTVPAIVSRLSNERMSTCEEILNETKRQLLHSATPDSVLCYSERQMENSSKWHDEYFKDSRHFSLTHYIHKMDTESREKQITFSQVTTYSRALADINIPTKEVHLLNLAEFQSENAFTAKLKTIINNQQMKCYVIIQCTEVNHEQNRINCAKYICTEVHKSSKDILCHPIFFIFVLQLSDRSIELKGWQVHWTTVHIDELKNSSSSLLQSNSKKLSELFTESILKIIQSCIQFAVKELNYIHEMDYTVITKKIKILQDVFDLNGAGDDGFAKKVLQYIKSCIIEEEKKTIAYSSWIVEQAKKHNEKLIYSSFHQSLVHGIEENLKPYLTSFLRQCDINNNLLLKDSQLGSTKKIWHDLFENGCFTIDIEKNELHPFTSKFPFAINLMVITDKKYEMTSNCIGELENNVNVLKKSLDGALPLIYLNDEDKMNYIYDYIHLKMDVHSEKIVELFGNILLHQIEFDSKKFSSPEHHNEINHFLACVKLVFDQYGQRLYHAAKIAELKDISFKSTDMDNGPKEMIADVKIVKHFLESIWPDKDFIRINKEWTLFPKKFKFYMDLLSPNASEIFRNLSFDLFKEVRLQWTKIRIFQLFVENVVQSFDEFDQICITIFFESVKMLKDNLETEDSWIKLNQCLNDCVTSIISNCYDQNENVEAQIRFNSFYIDLLSEFCFNRSDGLKVDRKVIEALMQQVLNIYKGDTSKLFLIQTCNLDERSLKTYLVKQLLSKDHKELFQKLLTVSLSEASQSNRKEDFWSICHLFISSCEDLISIHHSKTAKQDLKTFIAIISDYLKQEESKTIFNVVNNEMLETVAQFRYALSSACNLMYKVCVNKEDFDKKSKSNFDELLSLMERFCCNKEPHYYCVRYIIKKFGINAFQQIHSKYSWLQLEGIQEEIADVDVFLVYGEQYKVFKDNMRKKLNKSINQDTMMEMVEEISAAPEHWKMMFLMNEILFYTKNEFRERLYSSGLLKENIMNQISIIEAVKEESLKVLLLHFEGIIQINADAVKLIQLICSSTEDIKGLFLPGMPSDRFEEVKNQQVSKGAWMQYNCGNGHSTVVDEVGFSSHSYKCTKCGKNVGSRFPFIPDSLSPGNHAVAYRDTTKSGYCGGDIEDRSVDGSTERNLNSLSVALQRFLVDLAFYKLSLVNPEVAIRSITMPCKVLDVKLYFKNHILADIELLSKKLSNNSGDVEILLHLFLKHVGTSQWKYEGDVLAILKTKEGRKDYEESFDREVVKPFLEKKQTNLKETQGFILPLTQNISLFSNWKLWENYVSVSFSHFVSYIERMQKNGKEENHHSSILHTFLQQEEQFELIKKIPDLIKLQKILLSIYNFKYSKNGIERMNATDAVQLIEEIERKELKRLISEFCKSWQAAKKHLDHQGRCPIVGFEKPGSLGKENSLAYFICSRTGPGQCAAALIDYLAFLQQHFLNTWKSSDHLKFVVRSKVKLMDICKTDVINYTRENDLLPLLYNFCNYVSGEGKEISIEYDLENIEKRLVDKVCFGASIIDIDIKYIVYHDDVRASKMFNFFTKAVTQTNISEDYVIHICNELEYNTDLANALKAVEISIAFLSVTHDDGDLEYKYFVENVLLIDAKVYIKSPTLQKIKLKHLTSAWSALTVENCKRLYASNKVPFEIKDKRYQVELKDDVNINKFLPLHLVKPIVSLLTEFIIFKLEESPDPSENLFQVLHLYEDEMEKPVKVIDDKSSSLLKHPILVEHCYSFWKKLATKQN